MFLVVLRTAFVLTSFEMHANHNGSSFTSFNVFKNYTVGNSTEVKSVCEMHIESFENDC